MDREKKLGILENKINLCLKNINELKGVTTSLLEDIQLLKKNVIELNYKVPERKKGYLWDTWDTPKVKPTKFDYDKVI